MSENSDRMASALRAIDNLKNDIKRLYNDFKSLKEELNNEIRVGERKRLFLQLEEKIELIEILVELPHVSLKDHTDEFIWRYAGILLEKVEVYYLKIYQKKLNSCFEYERSLDEIMETSNFDKYIW